MSKSIIRELELYSITGIGSQHIIGIHNYIIENLINMSVSKHPNTSQILYKKQDNNIFIFDPNSTYLPTARYYWKHLMDAFMLLYVEVYDIIKYIMKKYYKLVDCKPVIGD